MTIYIPTLAANGYALYGLAPWTARRLPLSVDEAGKTLWSLCAVVSFDAPVIVLLPRSTPWISSIQDNPVVKRLTAWGYRLIYVEHEQE